MSHDTQPKRSLDDAFGDAAAQTTPEAPANDAPATDDRLESAADAAAAKSVKAAPDGSPFRG